MDDRKKVYDKHIRDVLDAELNRIVLYRVQDIYTG